jgi:hypothetical protein
MWVRDALSVERGARCGISDTRFEMSDVGYLILFWNFIIWAWHAISRTTLYVPRISRPTSIVYLQLQRSLLDDIED